LVNTNYCIAVEVQASSWAFLTVEPMAFAGLTYQRSGDDPIFYHVVNVGVPRIERRGWPFSGGIRIRATS
jgi:hypothetical protein